ncbi:hypothetical protein K4K54_004857 [Colletotrichum sp. SAR 10_86]|nr:hypothetical protein KHU50_009482 [Colletotrichum sp. SAR 10_65]KAI8225082.1 hypothetical protein K4K54_004857 [Colletotrichum sp. SAR 10_86]
MRALIKYFKNKANNKKNKSPELAASRNCQVPWLEGPSLHDPASWNALRQTGGIFRLPHELRHQILYDAFGGRTIHVDLRFRLPLHTLETSQGRGPRHGGYPPLVDWAEPPEGKPVDRGHDMAWRWYSCVCHHDLRAFGKATPHDFSCMDACLTGEAGCLSLHPSYDACQLGAMGFLLSCKQGHDELLDILYRQNRIFLENMPFIEALLCQDISGKCRLLGPGMELIASLRLRLDLRLFGTEKEKDRKRLKSILQGATAKLVGLRRLEIRFESGLYDLLLAPCNNMSEIDRHLFQPLIEARAAMRLAEMFVSIPDATYDSVLGGCKRELQGHLSKETNETMTFQMMRYPFQENLESRGSEAFWIQRGVWSNLYWASDGTPRWWSTALF